MVGAGIALWFAISVGLTAAFGLVHTDGFGGEGAPWILRPTLINLWIALPIVIPVGAALVAARREFGLTSPLGSGLAMFLLGILSWAVGNLAWYYYSTCASWPVLGCGGDVRIPFPSPADVLFLSSYPWCLAGAIQLSRALGVRPSHFLRRYPAPVTLAAITAFVGVPPMHVGPIRVGFGQLIAHGANSVDTTLVVAYMLGDIALIWIVLVLAESARKAVGGRFSRPLHLLVAGLGMLYVADLLFFRSVAIGTYSETGVSNLSYAAALALVPYAVYRFTVAPVMASEAMPATGTDAWHAAANAIMASHARVLGGLATQVADGTPGVTMRDGAVMLDLPYERSLQRLVATCCDRTGPLGRRLALEALDGVLAHRSEPRMQQVRDELALDGAPGRDGDAGGLGPLLLVVVMGTSAAAIVGAVLADGRPKMAAVSHGVLVGLTLLVCGIYVRRLRAGLGQRRREVDRSTQALGAMLAGLDGARQDERARVAGEIHDFALQQLAGATMHIDRARQFGKDMHPKARASAEAVEALLHGSIDALRRIMDGLQPSSLLHGNLRAALAEVAMQVEAAYSVQVRFGAIELDELPLAQQLLAYRAAAELITNAGKHSGATAVTVELRRSDEVLHLVIADDGDGFGQSIRLVNDLPAGRGWGLRLLLEQVLQADGQLRVTSDPGSGSSVHVTLPVAASAAVLGS